jgi:hypothetical protein
MRYSWFYRAGNQIDLATLATALGGDVPDLTGAKK